MQQLKARQFVPRTGRSCWVIGRRRLWNLSANTDLAGGRASRPPPRPQGRDSPPGSASPPLEKRTVVQSVSPIGSGRMRLAAPMEGGMPPGEVDLLRNKGLVRRFPNLAADHGTPPLRWEVLSPSVWQAPVPSRTMKVRLCRYSRDGLRNTLPWCHATQEGSGAHSPLCGGRSACPA